MIFETHQIFGWIAGAFFFLFGLYGLVTGKMWNDGTGLSEGGLIVGVKARVMGLLVMILGFLIGFLVHIT